jgi:hypothetical protein
MSSRYVLPKSLEIGNLAFASSFIRPSKIRPFFFAGARNMQASGRRDPDIADHHRD